MRIMLRWEKNSVGLWQTSRWSRYVWLGRSTYFERQNEASVTRVGDHWKNASIYMPHGRQDKTYVNDLLSGDKNRMSEKCYVCDNLVKPQNSNTAWYSVENNACPRACEVRSRHYIFHSEVGGQDPLPPPPPPLGSHCHMIVSLVAKTHIKM